MDNPLPDWLIPWLNRPGWQLLAAQWGVLAGVVLLVSMLLLAGEWQQRERLYQQRQQLELQIIQRQQQLNQLPPLAELQQRLQQQTTKLPAEQGNLGNSLYQVGGVLLRWQRQDKPAQQTITLRVDYDGLLRLLEGISPTQRIEQMAIEKQPEGLITRLTLLVSGESIDE